MMMCSKHSSLTAAAANDKGKDYHPKTKSTPPHTLLDDGQDDIETAIANTNTTRPLQQEHHNMKKGEVMSWLLRKRSFWVLLAIASVSLHYLYRNLQSVKDLPLSTKSQLDGYTYLSRSRQMKIGHSNPNQRRILYILRSFEGRYKSHLSLQALSWMQHLHPENEAILIASQFSSTELVARDGVLVKLPQGVQSSFSTPKCRHNNHAMGLCCQEAHALVKAAREKEYSSFEWVFVIDEDVFVSPSILREIVNDYNESSLVAIGTKGCVSKGISGFCGGGGYLISRPALEQTVASSNFLPRYMDICNKTEFCDIVTASMLNTANVTTLTDDRFHPWGIPEEQLPFSNISIFNDESHPGVAYRFILQQHSFLQKQTKVLPKRSDMFTHLLKHPEIVRAIASKKYATLHYFGGQLISSLNYTTREEKTTFLNLLYDIAISTDVRIKQGIAEEDEIKEKKEIEDDNTEKEVSCGNHGASSCAECPQGNGASWCNGECEWLDENGGGCQSKSKDEVRAIVKEEEEDIALPPSPNTRTHTASLASTIQEKNETLQQLVNRYFDRVETNGLGKGLESAVIKCQGSPDFNSTCLFSNIYTHEGSQVPCAYVVKGSKSADHFKDLPTLQLYGTGLGSDKINIIEYQTKKDLVAAANQATRYPIDLTATFTTWWPHNIGHGIWDGIWPIFVGLVRMGLKDAPFHPFLARCAENDKDFGLNNFAEGMVSDVYKAVSLVDSLSACEPGYLGHHANPNGGSYRMPLFVQGNGHLGQRNMNAQYELPGGRIAMRKFRDRIFTSLGVEPRLSCQRKQDPKKLKVNIFDNKRYSLSERSSIMEVVRDSHLAESSNIEIDFVDWSTLNSTRDQIQKVADTDVYVSGPGTGLVLSAFLNDGSVVLNLGQLQTEGIVPIPSYMEEYFAAASPHLRALYYDRCSSREVNSKELKKLIGKATDLTRSCFETSNAIYNSEINKSPVSRAFTQLFTKMEMLSNSNSNAPIPSYFYNTQVDTCDWAEELVFPQTKQCSAAVKEYGWDQAEYRQTLLQVLKDNNIDTQKCLDCVIDDTSGDCVSVEISIT